MLSHWIVITSENHIYLLGKLTISMELHPFSLVIQGIHLGVLRSKDWLHPSARHQEFRAGLLCRGGCRRPRLPPGAAERVALRMASLVSQMRTMYLHSAGIFAYKTGA